MFLMSQTKTTTSTVVQLGDVQSLNSEVIVRWARQTIGYRVSDYLDAHVLVTDNFGGDEIVKDATITFWRD